MTRRVAEKIAGIPGGAWTDLANVPLTGHFIGGCVMGDSPSTGVVDPYHRLYGHPGCYSRIAPIAPARPAVPPSAPAALPIVKLES